MGNTFGLPVVSFQTSIGILDSHVPFKEAAEPERSKIDVPDAVVDFFKSDVLADAHTRDADPLTVPADAAIGADVSDLYSRGGSFVGISRDERS
jgi:hypothetical protein